VKTRVLHNRGVAALLLAEVVSTTGSMMTWLALPWFVLSTTGSAVRMGMVVAAELIGTALVGIPGGALAGRFGARRTIVFTNAVLGLLILSVPILHAAGLLSFPLLLAIVFSSGAFLAPYSAAQRSALPELLGEDEGIVSEANAFLQAAQRLTIVLGPAIAGALIGVMGAPNVLFVDAATFLFAFVTIVVFVPRGTGHAPVEDAPRMLAGVRHVLREPFLRNWAIILAVGDAAWQALFAAIPFYAFARYHENAKLAGVLIGCFGLASLAGNVLSFRMRRRFGAMQLIAVGVLCQAVPLWLLVAAGPAWIVALALLLSGVANGVVNPSLHTVLTLRVPREIRTPALSAIMTADVLLAPAGYLVAGVVLQHSGVTPVFIAVALVQTVAMGARAASMFRERRVLAVATRAGLRADHSSTAAKRPPAARVHR
jgi:MFS family permease